MTAPDRVEAIFLAALDQGSPAGRIACAEAECADDTALLARVRELLDAHDGSTGPLDALPGRPAGEHPVDVPGAAVGPYTLVEPIGAGGMGTVWLAEQSKPVRRRVALKLVRAGLNPDGLRARFEAERQALALMDHPNIARVLDAGVADGRPYFAMELIRGVPVTEYCDGRRLTPRERLKLFAPVCHAVQHAHQKGVIHRDLKPSNVLVAEGDGGPVVKVIDFGVAKAAGAALTANTLVTEFGVLVGTLEYMSPEQAGPDPRDVDTRSDVYSLGVLLYELLAGSTPLTRRRVKEAGLARVLQLIREEDPPAPSARLAAGEGLSEAAAVRGLDPKRLTAAVRGELDWIVMKCLEKDRDRRYETAAALAADVHRYLADEPILACPPSTGYRLRKFVRRNKVPVLAGTVVFLSLAGGVVGTTIGLVQAERSREAAEKRLAQFEKGIDVLDALFADLDPYAEEKEGQPLRAILGQRLDRAAAAIDEEAVSDPLVAARLQDRLGRTYLGLGQAAKAEALFARAAATRTDRLGADHPDTLGSRHNHAQALEHTQRRTESIERFRQVHEARARVLGTDHLDTLSTLNELAVGYWHAGKPNDAIPLLEAVRDHRTRRLGADDDATLATMQDLAGAYMTASRRAEAIDLAKAVWQARVRKHGDDHPKALDAMASLASAYQAGYKMKEALTLLEEARHKAAPKLGDYHPLTLKILSDVAHMYQAYGRNPEAIALYEQVRERRVMVLGGYHHSTLITLEGLGHAYLRDGQPLKALPLFEQAAAGVERLNYSHSHAVVIVLGVATCHEELGQYEPAEAWRRKWIAVAKEKYGPDAVAYFGEEGLAGLGANLFRQKKYAAAEPLLRDSLPPLERQLPASWVTLHTRSLLGGALLGQQKYAEAEPHLVQGYQRMKTFRQHRGGRFTQKLAWQHMIEALERVVQLYAAWDRLDDAARWRAELDVLRTDAARSTSSKGK